jgi:CBS domain-containing protein
MLGISAKDIMTRDVTTIRKGSSIEEALRLMAEKEVSGLPVVDLDDNLEGIITETDVLLKGQSPVEAPRLAFYGPWLLPDDIVSDMYRKSRGSRVEDAMTRQVIAFGEESAVTDIARVMVEHNINRVPIVNGRKVVGIVSRRDIVRAMASLVNGPSKHDRALAKERKVIDLT